MLKILKCKLTDPEWRNAAERLAHLMADARTLISKKSAAMSEFNARAKELDTAIRETEVAVSSHESSREVECYEKPDERRLVVELWRKDSDELVDTRAMTAEERDEVLNPTIPGVELPKEPPVLGVMSGDLEEPGETATVLPFAQPTAEDALAPGLNIEPAQAVGHDFQAEAPADPGMKKARGKSRGRKAQAEASTEAPAEGAGVAPAAQVPPDLSDAIDECDRQLAEREAAQEPAPESK